MPVVVRFAPSPTGYLHIGGARTALFNWLYARHTGGKFLLRIEDTDRERSSQEAINAIFDSLKWLELDWDEPPVFQFARANRHAEVAHKLVKEGLAYRCYCSKEELEQMRADAMANGLPPRYNGYWRNCEETPPKGINPVIRFKAPQVGKTIINDMVQGTVELENSQLDDMVLLRADGTPTYMLSVVVDDHDMGITHVIRGDDHLTNMFRQYHLFKACKWAVPEFAHIPLIHGADGAKLSKRHGALGAEQYKEAGFIPESMRNYLLRLGWAHGNDEIISTQQAIEWFDVCDVGRSPARFDLQKLLNLNGHYIRQSENQRLFDLIYPLLKSDKFTDRVFSGMTGLKQRAKTINELADSASFYLERPSFDEIFSETNLQTRLNESSLVYLAQFMEILRKLVTFKEGEIDSFIRSFCKEQCVKLNDFLTPARIALTGSHVSPSLFEVINVLGREECMGRVEACISYFKTL
ncbi:MAG: glutamate--tRNA ligase [Holosporales bacterium]|jgi:glutamyl-tRNA synthetase|nr:glutamate--tRNA ligase [Holosporales bacterium]